VKYIKIVLRAAKLFWKQLDVTSEKQRWTHQITGAELHKFMKEPSGVAVADVDACRTLVNSLKLTPAKLAGLVKEADLFQRSFVNVSQMQLPGAAP
jgi:hypothetical protein